MHRIFVPAGAVGLAWGIAATGALAHVSLSQTAAPAGAEFRAEFSVGHGCGNEATTALRVLVDSRLTEAEAEAKEGWVLEVAEHDAAETQSPSFSREIRWTGGTVPAHATENFVVVVRMPEAEAGTLIFFPIVQECGAAVHRWIETPLPGERSEDLDEPAPFVTLLPASAAANAP